MTRGPHPSCDTIFYRVLPLFDCVYVMGACIGLIAAALHRQYVAEIELASTGVSLKEFQNTFKPRIVDKTTHHPEPPPDPEFDHKVARIQPQEVRHTYVFFCYDF